MKRSTNRRQRSRQPFATGWRSFFACLLSFSVVVAPFAAALHRAFVPHVVCEHGDLVETGESALAAADGVDARLSLRGEASIRELAAGSSEGHGHDHCSVGTLARQARCSHSPALVLTGQLDETIVFLGTHTTLRAWPLLLSAPKTSPPLSLTA